MSKRQSQYEKLLSEVIKTLKQSPKEIENIIDTSEKAIEAASDMTKDELELMSAYLRSDLKEFSESFEESKSGSFYLMIENSIWEGLASITDKTCLEWNEMFSELEKRGVYQKGDLISFGTLICDKCGHKEEYNHPCEVIACTQCGHKTFSRIGVKH
ncbi:zinc ribbon-containing protein [Vibrio salinus]|uniref:zinc ribbon-containing protein n=1 Tax=Vibrio salinus TaxID=2899784 RepID=UPI001E3ABA5E|nr:hypothetical protein [Vibrio salinus]MCE0493016.1 hypothetical protein [Vibrio salinus]